MVALEECSRRDKTESFTSFPKENDLPATNDPTHLVEHICSGALCVKGKQTAQKERTNQEYSLQMVLDDVCV